MGKFDLGNGVEVEMLGVSCGPRDIRFTEKEALAAIIAVEDILDMEGFSLREAIVEEDVERRHVFQLDDNDREYVGGIWYESFDNLLEVIDRLERNHKEKLEVDYEEFAENGLERPDPRVEKALILIENRTYIRDLLANIDADLRVAMKDKYYGGDRETLARCEALLNDGPEAAYFGYDALGRQDFDALGYLADKLIAAKIMDTQSAYAVVEYDGKIFEVYVDNGDISDFKEEIENGTLLECEGVCHFESYRDYIDGQVGVILDDFNCMGLYEVDGSWGFYLTEKELRHIGLGDALDKEIAWYEKEHGSQNEVLMVGENRFELVDELPLGYQFWNIGRNMPDGYLPMCRMAAVQPFEGARNIEVDTLKAVRLEGAQTVLRASIEGFETVDKMEAFVKKCSGKNLNENQQRKLDKVKDALEALKPLIEKPLEEKLVYASRRSSASQGLGTRKEELGTEDGVIK